MFVPHSRSKSLLSFPSHACGTKRTLADIVILLSAFSRIEQHETVERGQNLHDAYVERGGSKAKSRSGARQADHDRRPIRGTR